MPQGKVALPRPVHPDNELPGVLSERAVVLDFENPTWLQDIPPRWSLRPVLRMRPRRSPLCFAM
jgi:hypothetical protein